VNKLVSLKWLLWRLNNYITLLVEMHSPTVLTSCVCPAFQLMQTAKGLIDQLMNQLLPNLDNMVRSANLTGQQININAQNTMTSAQILFQNASTLKNLIGSFSLSPYDVAGSSLIIQQQLLTASQLTNNVCIPHFVLYCIPVFI